MARHAQIIGQATDWQDERWDIRERRATAHGFEILIGWPSGAPRGQGGRGVAVVLTVELAHYLTITRSRDVVLPIGMTTVKRLRTAIGISWSWDAWWGARAQDLLVMTLDAFCRCHGCSMGAASQRRAALRQSTDHLAALDKKASAE